MVNGFGIQPQGFGQQQQQPEEEGGFLSGVGGALGNLGKLAARGALGIGTLGASELGIRDIPRLRAEQAAREAQLAQTAQLATGQAPQFQTPQFQALPIQQQQQQQASALLAIPTPQAQELGKQIFGEAIRTPERTLASRKQTEVERAAGEAEGLRREQFNLNQKKFDNELERAVAETASGRIDKTTFDQAKVLRKELTDASKRFRLSQEGWDTMQSSVDSDNPIGDTALIFAFMKTLDPESVVREGEFKALQNASARTDRIGSLLRLHLQGRLLTKRQKQEIMTFGKANFGKAKKRQIRLEDNTAKIASNLGVGIEFINPTPTSFDEQNGAAGAPSPQAGGQAQAAPAGIDAGLAAQILQSRGF